MAVIQNNLTGDGSTVLFSFTFQYLEESHVKVEVDGVALATTQYSFANATTLQFATAPANGAAIRIFRDTDDSDVQAAFFAGSAIRASDLNDNFRQTLFVTQEVRDRFMDRYGTTMEGDLNMNPSADIVFEGSTADANETTLSAVDPTADRTILLPDVSGNVVTTGDTGTVSTGMVADSAITSTKIANGTIVDADISGSAEIAVSKLQDGSARQLLQTDAAGTGVQWTNDVDVPGSLDVTGATTLDSGLSVTGNISVSGTVDGRDVAADGTKLDGIESGATADQTAAEIRSLVESASNSNVFTDADHSKLNAIEAGATADQNAAEIRSLVDSASNSNVYIDSHHAILDGATVNTSELNVLDGITANTTELNQLDGRTITTSFNGNNANDIPTSSAINSYVVGLMDSLGGFVAIPNENSFPTSNPDPSDNAGTVVSIANAGGLVINGSGVATGQTTGAVTVTINGFPSSLHSTTLADGLGLQVQTTTTDHTYTYHKLIAKETDITALSDDINDFNNRYRVSATAPTSSLNDGDLWFDTTAGKMKVYDATDSAWEEVQSVGNFFINTLSSSSSTGGGSATFNGSAYRFTLSNAPAVAQQLLVSINGVIQKPNSGTSQPSEGFAIDTNDIIFAAAPASGSNFFIVTVGSTVNIGAPSNNTVNAAHIIDGSITNAEVSGSAAIAGTKISPNFGSQNVATTGSVGIGTTSPGANLHVQSTGDTIARVTSADGNGAFLDLGDASDPDGGRIVYDSGSNLTFSTASTERLRIDSAGRVGIGTTSPGSYSAVADDLVVGNHSGAHGITIAAENNNTAYLRFADGTANSGQQANGQIAYSHADLSMRFNVDAAERMRINSAGRVGIGTSNPDSNSLLTVNGVINLPDDVAIAWGGGSNRAAWSGNKSSNFLRAYVNGHERMRIDGAGKVGIGTTSPQAPFTISNGGAQGIEAGYSSGTSTNFIQAYNRSNSAFIQFDVIGNPLVFKTGSSAAERMRIGSSGDIGVNTTTLSNYSGYTTIRVNNNTNGGVFEVSNNNVIKGQLYYDGTQTRVRANLNTDLVLDTHDTERVRIKSTGNVGIGLSPSYSGPFGGSQRVLHIGGTAAPGLRISSSTSNQGDYIIQASNSGGRTVFSNLSSNADTTFRHSPGGTGTETIRFQNSGGISFNGDTATANALDDYERGTWTPTIIGLGNHNNIANSTWGKYTKVGNRVFITFRYSWSSRSTSNGGVVFLASLPFSAANDSYSDPVYIGGLEGIRSNSGREHYGGNVVNNTNTIQFRASGDNVSENSLFGSLSTSMSTGYIYGAANYIV